MFITSNIKPNLICKILESTNNVNIIFSERSNYSSKQQWPGTLWPKTKETKPVKETRIHI